jgi:hypothetical protein
MRTLAFAAAASLALALCARAEEPAFRIFGSAGNEGHFAAPDSGSQLNPDNFLSLARRANSADVTTYAELQPESRSWKLRAKMRAAQEDGSTRGTLGELYAQFSPRPWLDVSVGRRIEKWGTGYAWNPTGFVSPAKNPADPNDRLSANRGVDMLKVDALVHDTSLSAYVLPRFHDGPTAYAFRAYRLVKGVDVSVNASRQDGHGRVGASFAKVIGDALEIHGEAAALGGYAEVVAGAQYTFAGGTNVVVEVYHGGSGLTATEWNAFRAGVSDAALAYASGIPGSLLESNRQYAPLQMGRNYGFLRVAWPAIAQRLDVEEIALTSLRDGSTVLRSTISWKPRPRLALYVAETEFLAGRETELDYVQVRRLADAGVRIYF